MDLPLQPFDSKSFLKTLSTLPGVYRMLDEQGRVLYIGKARNLKKRVSSYFREHQTSSKTRSLVTQIRAIEVTITHTENEALILESTLIKAHQPRYNILLRDDKGYPYIYLSQHAFPYFMIYRGSKVKAGRYFGPYPNAHAVRDTLNLLQKMFRLRSCEDSYFQSRSRPCLQYQIKRCTAPCVAFVDETAYKQQLQNAILFLEGKSSQLITMLVQQMETAAAALNFEAAALCRNQIAELRQIQQRQHVEGAGGDLDVIACVTQGGAACVQTFVFRDGRLLGSRVFFPRLPEAADAETVQAAFLAQYYLGKDIPSEILISPAPTDLKLIAAGLSERAGRQIQFKSQVRGDRARWLDMAMQNAEHALSAHLTSKTGLQRQFEALETLLSFDSTLSRLECFDISHTGGERAVAACVVFDREGPYKSDYRHYNIEGITPGDDYAALHQALTRRYLRLQQEGARLPDILFIDGGKNQLAQAGEVLQALQQAGVIVIGITKGPERRSSLDTLYLFAEKRPLILPSDSAALHLVQQIRDEAHRFAITGHRQRRAKARTTSALDSIPGIGPKRRQALLKQFGGLKQMAQAGVEDICQVDGINNELARRIYDVFHG